MAMKETEYSRIKDYFLARYEMLEQTGQMPYCPTAKGIWASSSPDELFGFFCDCRLDKSSLLIDLGSGDGIVTCIAGLFTRAIGIEVDPGLCRVACRAVRDLRLKGRVGIICGDYREHKIWRADCLYIYPDKPVYELERMLNNWRGRLMIYGPHFPPRQMESLGSFRQGSERMTAYAYPGSGEAPSDAAGDAEQPANTSLNCARLGACLRT